MTHIQVTHTQERIVKIFKYNLEKGRTKREDQYVKTDDVLEEKKVLHKRVLFSGSYNAWKIYKEGHMIPPDVEVFSWRKGFPPKPVVSDNDAPRLRVVTVSQD